MADVNAPFGQAPAMAPPVRTNEQILSRIRWVPIGKRKCYLDMEKSQGKPIYKIEVDLLKNTNFFRAFTTSSTIPSIYIHQFWDTIQYNKTAGCFRIWEEFTQSIHTFIEDKRNLSRHTSGKKRATLIVIPSIRFTKLIIHHLQRRHRFHPRPDSSLHLPNEEPVLRYLKFSARLAKVAHHRRYLASKTRGVQDPPAPKPTQPARKPKSTITKAPPRPAVTSTQPAPTSAPAELQAKNRKQAIDTFDKPPKAKKSKYGLVRKKRTLKNIAASKAEDVPVIKPQVAAEDTDFQKALEESIKTAYAFPRGPLPPVSDSEEESDKVVLRADEGGQDESHARPDTGKQVVDQTRSDAGAQDEGQAGSNPDETSEGQARPDPSDAGAKAQSILSSVVHVGQTVNTWILITLSSLQHLSKDISFGDLFFSDRPLDADKNAKTEVESMVNVPIQQAMSSISLMTLPIIDLTSRLESPKVHQQFKATTTDTTTTTTTTLPPPQVQQQSTTEAVMVKRIGELEHIMANLIQVNKDIEESEVVTDAVDWAMQVPPRNCFRDLPEADIKEILHQRMWETKSYKSHEDHMQLFEALEKSMNRDHSDELAQDFAEAHKKKKKSRESPKTPPGSPSHQPHPPPPLAGPSRPSGALGAFGSSQVPPPPPPSPTSQESPSKGSATPSLSKTATLAEYQAWTTADIRLRPSISLTPADLEMDKDMAPDEQA
nr:hypothetical protein [Tanacetum cinerariifolium]